MESYELKHLEKVLVPGDIVIVRGYQPNKFVVSKGHYEYSNSKGFGWFLKMIPSGAILPLDDIDDRDITIVSSNREDLLCIPDRHPHRHDHHHCGGSKPVQVFKPYRKPDTSFVTVNTLDERNNLFDKYPPDGKMVRVNDVRGEVRYYQWDAESMCWDTLSFPPDNSEKVDSFISSAESRFESISDRLDSVDESITKIIEDALKWEFEEIGAEDGQQG